MELRNQLPCSHPLTAPVHPPERVTGPPELHHSKGRHRAVLLEQDEHWQLEGRRMFSLDSMAAIPPSADVLPELEQPAPAMP